MDSATNGPLRTGTVRLRSVPSIDETPSATLALGESPSELPWGILNQSAPLAIELATSGLPLRHPRPTCASTRKGAGARQSHDAADVVKG